MIEQLGDVSVRQITLDDLCREILFYNDNVTRFKLSSEQIRRAVETMYSSKIVHGIDSIAKNVKYDASCIQQLDMILEFCHKWFNIKEDIDIFKVLMKQWMWQVKRYTVDKKPRYHIWLNFTGASGLGKTEWLKMFCKPYEDVYTQCQVDVLFDSSREIKKLTDNFILNFDELAKSNSTFADSASASEMAIIKALLTADVFETRIMGGQTQMKAKRVFSCISSSNNHLYDTFYDPSTMRRYFEFECQVKEITDYSKLNNVMKFVEQAWRGIDENNDDGYFNPNNEIGKKIADIQATYYPTNTTVYAWLEEISADEKKALSTQNANDAFKSYKAWCDQEHCHSKTRKNFIDAVQHYGISFDNTANSFSDLLEDNSETFIKKNTISAEIDFTDTKSMQESEENHRDVERIKAESSDDDFISHLTA